MNTILVPTDFSQNAKNALNFAIGIAKKGKAKIILLHAYNITYLSPDMPLDYLSEQLSSAELESARILNVLCEKVKKENKITCEFVNQEGLAIDVILDTVKNKNPNLVIMGTKGATGLKEVLIGSNTAKVMGKAACPVIAIPEKATFDLMKKIVYATDYHPSDITALNKLVEFAKIFKSKIKVLHITNTDDLMDVEEKRMLNFKKKVIAKLDYAGISFQLLYAKNIEKKLEKYVKDESINLLAMSTRYRNLIERLFGKSLTKKLAYHTKVPLMAFHYKPAPLVFI